MIHLQKLGELIVLLGGRLDFKARKHGCGKNWSPNYVKVLYNYDEIINANIEGEHTTIRQYEEHIKCIKDCYITDILKRIVKDEKYHIRFLKDLLKHKCN
ncbi:ferritin-like domain-containing protein [Cellulosilyticum ruminicola]|uniref:ferritin-like domain-containing protein n=1 Tax=Cellulosilyticum ruminicola TaxID=425254 RepID=UPI00155DB8E5|nr:ferritin-like domain-containing protein [Cellulosilyticum ruminicola]